MKISKESRKILRNFSLINDSILFKPGKLVLTKAVANNITGEFELDEEINVEFGIYALVEFLGVLDLFQDPELTFNENYVTISEGKHKVKFFGADKSILIIPKERMSFALIKAEEDVTFKLTAEQLQQINKTSGVLRLPDVTFSGNGKVVTAIVSNIKDHSTNSYSMEIGPCSQKFKAVLKVENLKMIVSDYDVALSKTKAARFTHGNLVYHMKMEDASSID